jgi:hypothetical protein
MALNSPKTLPVDKQPMASPPASAGSGSRPDGKSKYPTPVSSPTDAKTLGRKPSGSLE